MRAAAVPFPDDLRAFVGSTPWTFAKTYAATWPHEYVVRTPENAAMMLALAQHIFDHDIPEHFLALAGATAHQAHAPGVAVMAAARRLGGRQRLPDR